LIEGWLQHESKVLLRGDFNAFPLFG